MKEWRASPCDSLLPASSRQYPGIVPVPALHPLGKDLVLGPAEMAPAGILGDEPLDEEGSGPVPSPSARYLGTVPGNPFPSLFPTCHSQVRPASLDKELPSPPEPHYLISTLSAFQASFFKPTA